MYNLYLRAQLDQVESDIQHLQITHDLAEKVSLLERIYLKQSEIIDGLISSALDISVVRDLILKMFREVGFETVAGASPEAWWAKEYKKARAEAESEIVAKHPSAKSIFRKPTKRLKSEKKTASKK